MPQSFAAVHLHVIFSTKNRAPLLTPDFAERSYDYLGGVAKGNKCALLAAGGVADHVHLLVSMGREISISALVRELKAGSSRWIHDTFPEAQGFAWQAGYGAFSVSVSMLDTVKHYIANQEEHHRTRSFQEEFLEFLRKHEMEWDERYVWD